MYIADALLPFLPLHDTSCHAGLRLGSQSFKSLYVVQEKGIELHEGVRIAAVEDRQLLLDSRQSEAYDECLWCTQAAAPAWLRDTDLTLGELLRISTPCSICGPGLAMSVV